MLIRREFSIGGSDLCAMYRPCKIDEVVGNDLVKTSLSNYITTNTLPHTLLFSGHAGCGKTTMARIIALSLNCDQHDLPTLDPCLNCDTCKSIMNQSNIDCVEINVGSASGKDAVESIISDIDTAPLISKSKVIIFDESHKLSSAAKDLLLKVMEDTYDHVYLIFCTNHPDKLKGKSQGNPFIDRCEHLVFRPVDYDDLYNMLINVVQFEGVLHNDEVLKYIIDISEGVPRKALRYLGKVISEASWDIDNVTSLLESDIIGENNSEIIELSRLLLNKEYKKSVKCFASLVKKYPVESIRVAVCGYFVGCLKKASKFSEADKISSALDVLTDPIYVTGKPAEHIFYNNMFKVIKVLSNK